jgi:hypothetical protein
MKGLGRNIYTAAPSYQDLVFRYPDTTAIVSRLGATVVSAYPCPTHLVTPQEAGAILGAHLPDPPTELPSVSLVADSTDADPAAGPYLPLHHPAHDCTFSRGSQRLSPRPSNRSSFATIRGALTPQQVASLDLRFGVALRTMHILWSEWCGPPPLKERLLSSSRRHSTQLSLLA